MTGALLATELDLPVVRFLSGPLAVSSRSVAAIGGLDFVICRLRRTPQHEHQAADDEGDTGSERAGSGYRWCLI
jgi:hypothetical protein